MVLEGCVTVFQTVKGFAERHLPEDIKRDHLEPLGHVDALRIRSGLLADDDNEVVNLLADDMFLVDQ